MLETRSAGGVVTNGDDKILVVSQHGTSWSLPKGHIDPGEDPLTAAKREIYEESGIRELQLVRELGTYSRYKIGANGGEDPSERKTITMFLFRTNQKELWPTDPDNPEARWVPQSEVAALLTHPKDKEFFANLRLAELQVPPRNSGRID
jgi:8-oxo-dGTP pyrophosphatase MutT (NUDIX family)